MLPRPLGPFSVHDPLAMAHVRLGRVNRAIAQWEDYEAARLLPGAFPHVERPEGLSLDGLRSLRAMLVQAITELEALRDEGLQLRRN